MTKKVDAWMPLVVDKYLGDTTHLTTEQHGAYLLLLMAMWKKGGRLQDVDAQLAQIVRLPLARWKQAIRPVLVDDCLLKAEGGWITQKRLAAELERAQKHSAAKAEAGSRGAAKRWQKDGTAIAQLLADESQEPLQMGAPIPIPSPMHPSDAPEDLAPNGASSPAASPLPNCPHDEIVALYHERLPELPRVKLMSDKRKDAIRKFWRWILTSTKSDGTRRATGKDQALTWIGGYFGRASENDWLMGRTVRTGEHANWQCDIDFLVSERGLKQVIEKTREAA
jgi:uncharacterized protein YdaU (DUF1376 family)